MEKRSSGREEQRDRRAMEEKSSGRDEKWERGALEQRSREERISGREE